MTILKCSRAADMRAATARVREWLACRTDCFSPHTAHLNFATFLTCCTENVLQLQHCTA